LQPHYLIAPITGKMRIIQYQKYLDTPIRFEIARKIVQSKMDTLLHLLEQLSKFYDIDIKKIQKGFALLNELEPSIFSGH